MKVNLGLNQLFVYAIVAIILCFASCSKNAYIPILPDQTFESTLIEVINKIELDQKLKDNLWAIDVYHNDQFDFQIMKRQNLPMPIDDTYGYGILISGSKEMFEDSGKLGHFSKLELCEMFQVAYGVPQKRTKDANSLILMYRKDMGNDRNALIKLSKKVTEEVYRRDSGQVQFKINTI